MKAFIKWDKTEHKKDLQMYGAQPARSKERQKGWKAALEWVKKEAISLDERGDISRAIINRELEQ